MRYSKVLAFAILLAALTGIPSSAPAQVSINGAGPWFHGPHDFHGHVDNRFDPQHGYAGPNPEHGEKAFNHFHGNEVRDGRGHVGKR